MLLITQPLDEYVKPTDVMNNITYPELQTHPYLSLKMIQIEAQHHDISELG